MIKLHAPIMVDNLTVSQYVLRRDGVDLPQWQVTSADGKLAIGPFSSLQEAIEAARSAQKISLDG